MTVIADTLPIFPECPTYGFTVEPRYLVKAIERDGGFERVDRRWSRPLMFYTAVPMGDRSAEDAQSVLEFYHSVGGMAGGFRFIDYADYKSCRTYEDPTMLDQPFTVLQGGGGGGGTGTPVGYQLTKEYITLGDSAGDSSIQLREIYKPNGATLLVANDSGEAQTDYTIDESSGILVPGGTFAGVPASWGGEFYVYARFTSNLSIALTNKEIQNINFTLRERRMNTEQL
jgi:uncharacterized protein (TIGR02217 family)